MCARIAAAAETVARCGRLSLEELTLATALVDRLNATIQTGSPTLWACLSPLARRAAYPPDIPFQAAEARSKTYNATIGQITDGQGHILALPAIERALAGLPTTDRNQALLYSPIDGLAELRQRWRERQRRGQPADKPSSLPLVVVGLTHGVSLVADLFGGEQHTVVVPAPFWGNYRLAFAVRTGARLVSGLAYRGQGFNCEVFAEALADLPAGEPAVVILNFPSNPGGYSPTVEERERIGSSLRQIADQHPLVVVCDDAYAGYVFEPEIPRQSMFWELLGTHPNLLPIKVDGATKEFCLFGGRVGFVTFPFDPADEVMAALESKAKCVMRGTVSSPVATSQVLLLQALRDEAVDAAIETVRLALLERYRLLKDLVGRLDARLLQPLPFNSGCFALLEIPRQHDVSSEAVRRRLLDHYDTGVIALAPNYLRLAFCSVAAAALPELVRRIEAAVSDLVS